MIIMILLDTKIVQQPCMCMYMEDIILNSIWKSCEGFSF